MATTAGGTTGRTRAHTADTVGAYLARAGEIPLLDRDEELRLADVVQRGHAAREELDRGGATPEEAVRLRREVDAGLAAQDRFVRSNLRLVVSIAKRFRASGVPFEDLIQDGNLGLMRAAAGFDSRGFKFSTYATWWITQAITRGIAATGRTVRLPANVREELRALQRCREELECAGLPAGPAEIARRLGRPEARVRTLLRVEADTVSLDTPLSDDPGATTWGDLVCDDDAVEVGEELERDDLRRALYEALGLLDAEQGRVLQLRFGLDGDGPRSLEEVAARFSVGRKEVRRIESEGLRQLRQWVREGRLEPLAGVR